MAAALDTYCLIGNPVAHSRSPWIHGRFAELTGEPMQYDRLLVEPGTFPAAVAALRAQGVRGCNVTVPFKFDAAGLATRPTGRALLAGACNTLRFDGDDVLGDNTDGVGLVRDIAVNAGVPLEGASVLLVGAGGAASGVLGPLIGAGAKRLVVVNRTEEKAQQLVARHQTLARDCGVVLEARPIDSLAEPFDIVVNGTASSLSGGATPVSAAVLRPGTLALDMMYGPSAQPFLDWASGHGAQPRDGLGMLVEQAAESFLVWRGVRPPSAAVLSELRERLR